MVRSRIVLGQLPPLLADLVRQLLDEGTEVWDLTSAEPAELIDAVARHDANVVVVIATGAGASAADHELSRQLPGIALATLDARGRSGARYLDGILEFTADDLSPRRLRMLLQAP